MEKPSREHHFCSPIDEDRGQRCCQFKGIRFRKWGSWVSEIRMPKTRQKIWLGSYKTAEQAARAYDAAVYCLRGPSAKFNFPDSVPAIPSASSLSRKQIQVAAAKYALDEIPAVSSSLQNISDDNNNMVRENPISLSQPSSILEMELPCDSQQISQTQDMGLLESPFNGNGDLRLERIPSIDEMSALDLTASWQEEQQQDYMFFEPADLWKF